MKRPTSHRRHPQSPRGSERDGRIDFLNAVSHDLRTPLTAIMGYSDILEDGLGGPLTERQSEYVNAILRSAHRLRSVVDRLLELAQYDGDKPGEGQTVWFTLPMWAASDQSQT